MQAHSHQTRTESLVNAIQDQTSRLELSPLYRSLPTSSPRNRIKTERYRLEYCIGNEESAEDRYWEISE